MDQTTLIIVIAVLVMVAAALLLLRARRQHVGFDATAPVARAARPEPENVARAVRPDLDNLPRPAEPPTPAPAPSARDERHGVGSEVTAAIEDVVDQFIGLDAHPSGQLATGGPGDELTRLKGLGPKAASLLGELGVTRFEQIANWDEGDVAAIDARMGAFKGRIARDRWVEQARLLATGETEAYEAAFGKLGS